MSRITKAGISADIFKIVDKIEKELIADPGNRVSIAAHRDYRKPYTECKKELVEVALKLMKTTK